MELVLGFGMFAIGVLFCVLTAEELGNADKLKDQCIIHLADARELHKKVAEKLAEMQRLERMGN